MKKLLSLIIITLFLFTGCELKDEPETNGNIPGMGNAEGELQTTPFTLPESIEIVGTITGASQETSIAFPDGPVLKSTDKTQTYSRYGSGGQWVSLVMTMSNTSSRWKTIYFPQGMVFRVNNPTYQHGILLQWTIKSIPPNQTITFVLNLYCINKGLNGSDSNVQYSIAGISSSPYIWKLLNLIGRRMINFGQYFPQSTNSQFKSADVDYSEITEQLQDAVWAITNGNGLSDEQIDFIESIPVMEEGTYPEGLFDPAVELPEYYEEYTPAE